MTTFVTVGAGWRAEFFWRLADALPGLDCAGAVVRSPRQLAVPTFASLEEAAQTAEPDFVVTATPWPVTPDVVREAVGLGLPVLAETPPAPDLDGLRLLWADVGDTGLVQVAEQYLRMPSHAARAAVVGTGAIGTASQVQVSSTHQYHAVALVRGLLGAGRGPVTVRVAVTWWAKPIDGALSGTHGSLPARLTPVSFAMRGITPIGYAVFALVLGVAIGLVVRRPLPAMAITLVLFIFVQIAVPLWVRPHLSTPVSDRITFSRDRLDGIQGDGSGKPEQIMMTTGGQGDWLLANETLNANGQVTALPSWFGDCLPRPPGPGSAERVVAVVGDGDPITECLTRLNAEGYRQRVTFQPAERFWRLQWLETGMFLAVSALLAWFCFWWTRRRLS